MTKHQDNFKVLKLKHKKTRLNSEEKGLENCSTKARLRLASVIVCYIRLISEMHKSQGKIKKMKYYELPVTKFLSYFKALKFCFNYFKNFQVF